MLKRLEIKIYQAFANLIYKKLSKAPNIKELQFWYSKGMELNQYCIDRNIYLQ